MCSLRAVAKSYVKQCQWITKVHPRPKSLAISPGGTSKNTLLPSAWNWEGLGVGIMTA